MKRKIAGFLHYRTDLGDGTRTGVVFSDCILPCGKICLDYHFLPEHNFSEDSLEKSAYSEEELISYLKEEKTLCYTKNLGITFLGKEPLSDPFFCKDVAKGIKEAGMTLQIYTCGMCSESSFDLLDGLVDLYVLRLFFCERDPSKNILFPEKEQSFRVIDFFEKRAYPYRLLIPVILGINENLGKEISEYIKTLKSVKSVILDFSKSGFSKEREDYFKSFFLENQIALY